MMTRFIRASLWGWPECCPKHVAVNFVNRTHHKYCSAFVGYLNILDQTNARRMEHIKIILTIFNKYRFFLLAREIIGWNSGRKPVKPDWGFVRFSSFFAKSSTVPYSVRQHVFSAIFQSVRNARQYFQLSYYPFLSHSFQFNIYNLSFTDIL